MLNENYVGKGLVCDSVAVYGRLPSFLTYFVELVSQPIQLCPWMDTMRHCFFFSFFFW